MGMSADGGELQTRDTDNGDFRTPHFDECAGLRSSPVVGTGTSKSTEEE
jgi:hypothetical protein